MSSGMRLLLAAGLALPISWGCGSSAGDTGIAPVPAKGKVSYRGKPLTHGQIVFEPDYGREAHGAIQANGTFVLSTTKEGDGAVTGTHRVAISGTGKKDKDGLPTKFKSLSTSNTEVEVTADKTDYEVDFK